MDQTLVDSTPDAPTKQGKLSCIRQIAAGKLISTAARRWKPETELSPPNQGSTRRRDHLEELCDVERVIYFIGH